MPYLSKEQQRAMAEWHLSNEMYERAKSDVAKAGPTGRVALLEQERANLIGALERGEYFNIERAAQRVRQLADAIDFAAVKESTERNEAAKPNPLPKLLSRAPILGGEHHGKRFDGDAELHSYQSKQRGYEHEWREDYFGEVGGVKAWVPAAYIDWCGVAEMGAVVR